MFRKITRDESGGTMIFFGFAILMLTIAVGCAVDMARAQTVRTKLALALDAAGLAAGATMNSEDVQSVATKFFNANFDSIGLGATVGSMTAVPTDDKTKINLNATVTLPATLMRVAGFTTLTLTAASEITRTSKGMELVLVLDTTGSMDDPAGGGITKMQAAKNASNALLNILYGDKTSIDNLWVGLVPFAQSVNIGTSHASWTVSDSFDWGPTSWGGCVDARYNGKKYATQSGYDVTDDPPSVASFPKYYWPCDATYNPWYGNNSSHNDCDYGGSSFAYKSINSSRGPNRSCVQAMTPMTKTKATIVNALTTLTPDGNTHIVLGASWAWRMLSPRWRSLWGGEMNTDSLPLNYDTPLMNKVMILMTDGDNTIGDSTRGSYWYLSDKKLGSTNSSTAVTELDTRLQAVCTSMKAQHIIVYTIAFGTGITSTARDMLKNCATKEAYYFYSPTGADLEDDFKVIGDSLANLRVSK